MTTGLYLHGGWRCGSTYLWSKCRSLDRAECFYEPFHENLARWTVRKIRRNTASAWNSRHPPLDRPYFEEYVPLIRGEGVPGFREELSLRRYFCGEASLHPEVDYLARLRSHAERLGKVPVMGFSRSLGRVAGLRRVLGGFHVVVRRDAAQQWASCRNYSISEDMTYFELCHFMILALAPEDSLAGRYARSIGLPRLPDVELKRQFRFLRDALWPWSDELSWRAFIAVRLLGQVAAEAVADLVVDIDRLSRSQEYREQCQQALLAGSGLQIQFRDCQMPARPLESQRIDLPGIEQDVMRTLRDPGGGASRERVGDPASISAAATSQPAP